MGDDREIRGSEVLAGQRRNLNPLQPGVFVRMRGRRVRCESADEWEEGDVYVAVIVIHRGEGGADDHLAAEFFPQFTLQRGGRSLIGFHLAAGKLPLSAEMFV